MLRTGPYGPYSLLIGLLTLIGMLAVFNPSARAAVGVQAPSPTLSASTVNPVPAAAPLDGSETLPPGAQIQTILPNMVNPIAMAFDPQGRLFYTEKTTGNVRLFANGTLQASPVITFSV